MERNEIELADFGAWLLSAENDALDPRHRAVCHDMHTSALLIRTFCSHLLVHTCVHTCVHRCATTCTGRSPSTG